MLNFQGMFVFPTAKVWFPHQCRKSNQKSSNNTVMTFSTHAGMKTKRRICLKIKMTQIIFMHQHKSLPRQLLHAQILANAFDNNRKY